MFIIVVYLIYLNVLSQFSIACNISFYLWQALAYLLPTHMRPKAGGVREKKSHDRDDGFPDKERGSDCYEILFNVRDNKVPLVRDLRAGKTRCSRIRVFVDRAKDCRCIHIHTYTYIHIYIHIFKITFTLFIVDPSVFSEKKSMRKNVAGYTGIIVISLDRCPKSRAKQNACFNVEVSIIFKF